MIDVDCGYDIWITLATMSANDNSSVLYHLLLTYVKQAKNNAASVFFPRDHPTALALMVGGNSSISVIQLQNCILSLSDMRLWTMRHNRDIISTNNIRCLLLLHGFITVAEERS